MKRATFLIICSIFTVTVAFAQGTPVAKFDVIMHDFGDITEEDGDASYSFNFTNVGDAPLVITKVTASCGCTTPSWTKEPIAVGGKGVVTATYGAKGRPGPFSKTISVYSNDQTNPIVLSIKGNVATKKLSPEEVYPVKMGDLFLKQSIFLLGNVTNTEKKTQAIEVYNAGTKPLTLKYAKLPKYITVSSEPQSISANSTGTLTMVYNASLVKTYGKNEDSFEVIVNDDTKNAAGNVMKVSAIITDNFSGVDAASAPKLALNPTYVNFGKMSETKEFSRVIKISNSGPSDLILRSVKTSTPEATVSASKTIVKSGEIIEIKLTAQAKKVNKIVNGILEIITNDPNNSVREIRYYVQP